jgi:hypothetical protein
MIDWTPIIERMIDAINKWDELNPNTPFEWTLANTMMLKAITKKDIDTLLQYITNLEGFSTQINAAIPQDTDTDITV